MLNIKTQSAKFLKYAGVEMLFSICVAAFIWLMTKIIDYLSIHIPQYSFWSGPMLVFTIISTVGILFWLIFYYPINLLKRNSHREAVFALFVINLLLALETAICIFVLYSLPERQF